MTTKSFSEVPSLEAGIMAPLRCQRLDSATVDELDMSLVLYSHHLCYRLV